MGKKRITPPEEWTAQAIIDLIKAGNIPPWARPWSMTERLAPRNLLRTNTPYAGLNLMLLTMVAEIHGSPYFITPKQLHDMGGKKKDDDQKTWPVFFWKPIKKKEDGEDKTYWLCKGYKVYNVNQTSGIEDKIPELPKLETFEHDAIQMCEDIADGYTLLDGGPEVITEGERALYSQSKDIIKMPPKDRFRSAEEYYATLFHEMTHSTGHPSRLNRESLTQIKSRGDHMYSEEELVAEFGAAMLCGKAGIATRIIQNSAAYIKHWGEKLDAEMLVLASRAAKKAFKYMTGEKEAEQEAA